MKNNPGHVLRRILRGWDFRFLPRKDPAGTLRKISAFARCLRMSLIVNGPCCDIIAVLRGGYIKGPLSVRGRVKRANFDEMGGRGDGEY